MNSKKCIIIGSGLGGLSTGVILAQNGYKVHILEQQPRIGGCLQCFTRHGAKFETGMHFIGGGREGQILRRLMRYLKLNDLKLRQLDAEKYDILSLKEEKYLFANGRKSYIERISSYFPSERKNLEKYFDIIERVAQASSLRSLRNAQSDVALNAYYQTVSINSVLDEIFTDERIKNVLAYNIPLFAGEKDVTPFAQYAFITDFYNQSAFRVVGGSEKIAESMKNTIIGYGGEVDTSCKVTRIICNDTKAVGVEVNGEEFHSADVIISAIHPARLMEMLDTKIIRPAFRERMTNLRNTTGSFCVYLQFKENTVPYMNSNFYSFDDDTPWGSEKYTEETWPKGYLYMHLCDSETQMHAKSGIIISYMNFNDVARWKETKCGQRGKDYEAFKEQKAKKLIGRVEKDFPGFSRNIERHYTSTPLTYRDYTGTQDGSMYGVAKDISVGVAGRVPYKTRIPNLYLTGQNVNSHGILGVIVGSIVVCSELLTSEKIYRQIIESSK